MTVEEQGGTGKPPAPWLQEAHVAVGATFKAWSICLPPKAETLAPLIYGSSLELFSPSFPAIT